MNQGRTFFETDEEGRVREVDMITGEIVRQSETVEDLIKVNPNTLALEAAKSRKIWKFHPAYGELICEKVASGLSISEICQLKGFPSIATLARWRAENPGFNEALTLAKKMRAEIYHDLVVRDMDSDETVSKDEVPGRKLKFDRLKWLAGVNDPETYGNRTKISGDSDAPLQIIVGTGIDRGEKSGENT